MRKPMITRTIKTTEATVLCLDVETAEPCNRTFTLPRTYNKDSEILKAVAPMIAEEANLKAVHVVDVSVNEQLYGMPEADFIKYAQPIVKAEAEAETAEA